MVRRRGRAALYYVVDEGKREVPLKSAALTLSHALSPST